MAIEDFGKQLVVSSIHAAVNHPASLTLVDRLLLLSPRTWYGLVRVMVESPFTPLDIHSLIQGMAGTLIPVMVAILLQKLRDDSKKATSSIYMLLPYLLAPWTISCLDRMLPLFAQIVITLRAFLVRRSITIPSAIELLQERIQNQRAYSTRRFDVYLPSSLPTNSTTHPAMLFFPGALVPHTAYAPVAARLSDAGLVVVVVSFEPTRLVHVHLGLDPIRIRRIAHSVQNHLRHRYSMPHLCLAWSLAGHSMGSFGVMKLAQTLLPFQKEFESSLCPFSLTNKLVMWGTGAFPSVSTDLSSLSNILLLLVQGTQDVLVAFGEPHQEEFDRLLPPQTRHYDIVGGTHDGFGSYISPWRGETLEQDGDDYGNDNHGTNTNTNNTDNTNNTNNTNTNNTKLTRTATTETADQIHPPRGAHSTVIPRDAQQSEACAVTASFLLS